MLSSQKALAKAQSAAEEATETCGQQKEEISGLKSRLAELSGELDKEREARKLAAAEAESRYGRGWWRRRNRGSILVAGRGQLGV